MQKNHRIVCGRFDRKINFESKRLNDAEKIRIGSENTKHFECKNFEPIATDGKVILHNGQISNIRDFLATKNQNTLKNLIVLTFKERGLILNELVDFDLRINVFEELYPIFKHIKYVSNLNKNYYELKKSINKVKKMGIKGNSLAHYISNEHLFRIERKLRFKNKLDYFFAFAYKPGYQEVFKLKEERHDRVVIAFDFNSMYLACMDGDFVEPRSIEYKDYKNDNISSAQIFNGLYRVVLKYPKETFFREFHPFKFNVLNNSFYFNLEKNQTIELLLFKNEIDYYTKFFNEIDILEGFCSEKTIKHPLMKRGAKIYKDRQRYKSEKNNIMHDLCKFNLVTMHSATNLKKFRYLRFKTINGLIECLSSTYMIEFSQKYSDLEKLDLLQDHKYFAFKKNKNGYEARLIDFERNDTVYSLSAQILANARLKMIKTIERFLSHNSVEVCYSNIDSIHISILKSEVNSFLFENEDMISNRLGDLKIQSVSDKGYWFDVGRYWLINGDTVSRFKNILFNHNARKTKFAKSRELKFVVEGEDFSYVKTAYTSIENAFSYHKKIDMPEEIDSCRYSRYRIDEIIDLEVAGDTYNKELLSSKKLKFDLFKKIATV